MTVAEYFLRLVVGPLAGRWGQAFVRTVGGAFDAATDAIEDAGLLRGPFDAPDDALASFASARGGLARIGSESFEAYRGRLVGAWETWSWAGTAYGIADTVALLGYGTPAVLSWHVARFDAHAARWSRMVVMFTGRATFGAARYGAAQYGARFVQPIETADPTTAREQLRATLRRSILARDRVLEVVIAHGNAVYGRARYAQDRFNVTPSTRWGPYRYGETGARYGRAVFGAFC